MWRKRNELLLIVLLLALTLCAQERIRCMSWNVENLFDCVDDSLTDDNPFLPEATRHWSTYRYWSKLQALSRVVASAGDDRAPDLVALCEVENDSVMRDLTRRSSLRSIGYDYLMTASADPRGIDVALMYKPTTFRPFASRSLRLPQSQIPPGRSVRDVLVVSGRLHMGDTLDVLVCHLPSRLNGRQATLLRRSVVEQICSAVDSLFRERAVANIMVLGDFNDVPHGSALRPLAERIALACITDTLGGSYRYKGKWEQIDHVYLSVSLLRQDSALRLSSRGAWIFAPEFLIEPEPLYGGYRPCRTYNGMRYVGGTSDHLPVCFDLCFGW